MIGVPSYWMNETSGVLRPAVEAYLNNRSLNKTQIAVLRAYLRQWIAAPAWVGPEVERLRDRIDFLVSRGAISCWLSDASEIGIDPF